MYRACISSGVILSLIAGIGVATLGLVILAGVWAGAESDAAALERQRGLVTRRLSEQVAQVSEAIEQVGSGYMSLLSSNLSHRTSSDTVGLEINSDPVGLDAAESISSIVVAVFGYDRAFVVDGNGQLAMRSDPVTTKRYLWMKPLLAPLLQDQKKIGQAGSDLAQGRTSVDDRQRGAFAELMRLEGRPTIVGIAPISRRTGSGVNEESIQPEEKRFLIAIRFLDGDVLDDLSREQGLNGARFARSADPEENEVAVQIDAGATGEPIGFIVWTPDLPGSRVIGRLLPALSGAALVIVVLFLLLLVRLRASLIELKLSEATAQHLASHDVLTGLPNRSFFSARLEECLANMSGSGPRWAIALIDLDRFKAVNDTFGHATGDELIRTAAERMRTIIRPCDTLARLGGDEFALLLRDIGSGDALLDAVSSSLITELKRPFYLRSGEVVAHVGGSIGMTTVPPS
ncbi:MAG: diguanylate cyclase, partial [Alphaproteobacteria bacterium]